MDINVLNVVVSQMAHNTIVMNPKQKQYFLSQRRNTDTWGRMMLLKPNRRALDYNAWLYYDYFVHDFLQKVFAVSLLNDK